MIRTTFVLLMLPALAFSSPELWMIVENPDELAVDVYVGRQCPITEQEILTEVSNVLTRSQIKVIKRDISSLFLRAELQCAEQSTKTIMIANFSLNFAQYIPLGENRSPTYMRFGLQNSGGSLYYADTDRIKQWVRTDTEDVIADYLQANMGVEGNLGE